MRAMAGFDGRVCNWLLRSALASWAAGGAPLALSADTGIALQLDADWVTWIRAQRRAQGLDAPDAAADAQFQAMLQRLHGLGRPGQEPATAVLDSAAGERCVTASSWLAPVLRGAEAACRTTAEID